MNGFGAIYYENGEKYIGEFVDGKKDGTGVYIYANNEKFVGSWEKDRRNGAGKSLLARQLQQYLGPTCYLLSQSPTYECQQQSLAWRNDQ